MFARFLVFAHRAVVIRLSHPLHSSRRKPPLSSSRRRPGSSSSLFLLWFSNLRRIRENRLTSLCCSVRHPAGRVTFSACPEKVTKERAPGWGARRCAPSALRAAGVLLTGHPGLQRNERDPSRSPALTRGPCPSALRRPTRVNGKRQRRWVPACAGTTKVFSSSLRFCGQDGRALLCPGPSRPRRGRGGKSPTGARARCARVRCRHRDVPSANLRSVLAKSPGRSPATAAARVPFSLVTFSWASKRK